MSQVDTPHLDAAVDHILARGDLATAAVVAVETPSARVFKAYGTRHDGRPASLDDISGLYCASKPLLGVAVISLVQEGVLKLDVPIENYLDWLRGHWIGSLSVEDLLTHNSNLHRIGAVVPIAMEPSRRGPLLKLLPPEDLAGTRGYSDFGAWFLLAHVVESTTGQDFRDVVIERVTEPYGIEERSLNVGIPPELFDEWRDDISINMYGRNNNSLHPLAAEAARIWACAWSPATSTYGSAASLAKFYRAILDDLAGAARVLSTELTAAATKGGEIFYDVRLKRDSSFGLGFMVNLPLFRLGPSPSTRSFGHVGVGGGSLGFADPDYDLAGAVIFNSVFDEGQDLLVERGKVVSGIYADLGLVELPGEDYDYSDLGVVA